MVADARKSRVIVVVVATTTGSATQSHLASILPNRRQGYPTSDERVLDLRNAIPPANDADKGRVPESRRRTCRTPHTDTNTATSGTARRANGGGGLAQGGRWSARVELAKPSRMKWNDADKGRVPERCVSLGSSGCTLVSWGYL